ncbi:hypothetical protein ACQPZ2_30315 [Nocardia pseudovaccinii]|uniref:hypothetical protein n=1 Tax=Nocardia pseudovaccinii TaxID=189540 RepID=UPI003D8B0BAB
MKLIEDSLSDISRYVLVREVAGASTHTAIVAEGLELPAVTLALGRYLVAALAGVIDLDASLSTELLGQGIDARMELAATVSRLVGDTNIFVDAAAEKFRDTQRNAWIAEGVAHALLVVRALYDSALLVGPVHALKAQHSRPSQQGLDLVAIYSDNAELMVAIGESKASRSGGSAQLTEAASMFRQIDNDEYGPELRSELLALRKFLSGDLVNQVTSSLWLEKKCYVPVIVHEREFDVVGDRPSLGALKPPLARRRLVALRLVDFHAFFDSIADAMRAGISEVVL